VPRRFRLGLMESLRRFPYATLTPRSTILTAAPRVPPGDPGVRIPSLPYESFVLFIRCFDRCTSHRAGGTPFSDSLIVIQCITHVKKELCVIQFVGDRLEKVTVPAGTFDAYRIERDIGSRKANADANITKGRIITWYAPAVKKYVRRESMIFSNGRERRKDVDELLEYSLREESAAPGN